MLIVYALFSNYEPMIIRYVGVTRFSIFNRLKGHIREARSGKKSHKCNWLRKINFKSGTKIIEIVDNNTLSWQKAEKKWIKYYRDRGYPLTNENDGGKGGLNPSKEARLKNSIAHSGKNNSWFGKRHTDIWKRNMSKIMKGRKFSEITRENISKSLTGRKLPLRVRLKMSSSKQNISKLTRRRLSKAGKGRKHSKFTINKMKKSWQKRKHIPVSLETRLKISIWHKGKKASKKTRLKMSRSMKGLKRSELTRKRISIAKTLYWKNFRINGENTIHCGVNV